MNELCEPVSLFGFCRRFRMPEFMSNNNFQKFLIFDAARLIIQKQSGQKPVIKMYEPVGFKLHRHCASAIFHRR